MGNEFWAAVAGAVVGGVIAFIIQLIILREAAKQRAKENDERRQALGHALLFKMIKIHSNLYGFDQHLEERFAEAEKDGFEGEPWQIYLPLANTPAPVRFSTDEMAMLLSLKDDDLFNDIVSLDEVHNGTIDIFRTLNARRQALTEELPAKMEGAKGETILTAEQLLFLRPKMVEINLLVESTREWCKTEEQNTRNSLTYLHSALKEKVGLTCSITFKYNE
jgi:hypothetical protein